MNNENTDSTVGGLSFSSFLDLCVGMIGDTSSWASNQDGNSHIVGTVLNVVLEEAEYEGNY
jgi:hypothetical protein